MDIAKMKLSEDLRMNTVNLRTLMENSSDLIIKYGKVSGNSVCFILCEGMTGTDTLANMLYRPLNELSTTHRHLEVKTLAEHVQNELLIAAEQQQAQTYEELAHLIMSGFAVLLIEGLGYGIAVGVQGFKSRSVEQATTHLNLRSSRESFNEVIRTNLSLVRRRVKSPSLIFNMMTLGDRSKTDVCVCYIKDKADAVLVKQIKDRLKRIDINSILESGFIQPFLQDKNNMVFSEIGTTERPDTFAAKLYDGRIGIIVDNTPFALYVPQLFIENFQTMDDYSGMPVYVTLIRWLKYFAAALTVLLPGFYVALANFHPELFPNSLLFNLSVSTVSTPYPLLLECVIIHVMFEIMREAGLRLPTYVGHAVSIIGGLVIGQIVVSAGLVGAPMVLIVAVTAISSFIVPDLYDSIVVLRFGFMLVGGFWGLYGITLLAFIVALKICSMSNHGVPYTAPLAPFSWQAMRDVLTRVSWHRLVKRDVRLQDLEGVEFTNDE